MVIGRLNGTTKHIARIRSREIAIFEQESLNIQSELNWIHVCVSRSRNTERAKRIPRDGCVYLRFCCDSRESKCAKKSSDEC